MKKIKGDITLQEIGEKYPQVASFLMERYNIWCFGCPLAAAETLEQGARAHGFNKEEIEKMIEEINELLNHSRRKGKKQPQKKVP